MIKEYSRLLGVQYYTDSIVTPPSNQGFRSRMSEGIKRSIIEQKWGTNECALNFLYYLFSNQDIYKKNSSAFQVSHEEWKQNRGAGYRAHHLGAYPISQNSHGDWYWAFTILGTYWTRSYIRPSTSSRNYKSAMHHKGKLLNTFRMLHLTITSLILGAPCSM